VQVKRDFERIYREEHDPWSIGDADSERYDLYRERLLAHARGGSLLDIGCGLGAFLARFQGDYEQLVGVDTSARAIARAQELHPEIEFLHVGAEQLAGSPIDGRVFDAIVMSDVVYYLPEAQRRDLLEWARGHLAPAGTALVAAWCPGGDYLTADELAALTRRSLRIREQHVLDSGHVLLLCDRKRRLVSLTFDYETWQPIPEGRTIDWHEDVVAPAGRLLDAADAAGLRVTLFAEVGELLWLDENDPEIARLLDRQLEDAVARGHDVQLHLHPSWLPETGAARQGGRWHWEAGFAKADAYPGDLDALIRRCVQRLEELLRPVDPGYRVTCFRAGAYQAQPFRRLAGALAAAGIAFDSSVYAGGVSEERGYDYSTAWSERLPYFASPWDPQLPAPPAEQSLVELPVCVVGGSRVMLDGPEGGAFAGRLHEAFLDTTTSERSRLRSRAAALVERGYERLAPLALVLPKAASRLLSPHGPGTEVGHDYAVAIGHTKGGLEAEQVVLAAARLAAAGCEVVTLSELAKSAQAELLEHERAEPAGRPASWAAILDAEVPLDRERVLCIGDGADRLAARYSWFTVSEATAAPFPDGSFDCVYADGALARADDPDAVLREAHRVLAPGGVLVAAVPSDARNPRQVDPFHTWKTQPADVRARLLGAGFAEVDLREIDGLRHGGPPHGPSNDRVQIVRAWRRDRPATQLERAQEAMAWLYRRLDPSRNAPSIDAVEIIAGGAAFCAAYAVALFSLLRREGYDVRIVQMEATGHPRGRGPEQRDSHVVVQAKVDGSWVVLDPMAGTVIPHPVAELLRHPELASGRTDPDERHAERGYALYDSAFWYSRVARYQVHRSTNPKVRVWRRNRRA